MTETALAAACCFLALAVAALSCCVPWLFWRCLALGRRLRRAERKVRLLDTAVAGLLEMTGVGARLAEQNGKPPGSHGAGGGRLTGEVRK